MKLKIVRQKDGYEVYFDGHSLTDFFNLQEGGSFEAEVEYVKTMTRDQYEKIKGERNINLDKRNATHRKYADLIIHTDIYEKLSVNEKTDIMFKWEEFGTKDFTEYVREKYGINISYDPDDFASIGRIQTPYEMVELEKQVI